ncbi:MAG TPA: RagB/SusD family nutrient uptake outer membrane protein [Leeuwenhoekiella sp.]|nr:RagB/SusD family nutrient uptake outer membrane protein [Leeuwenhoekiella sp.]
MALVFVGCNDELKELEPFVQGNPSTFFNTEQTFQYGVDGAYAQFFNYYADGANGYQGLPDILSDNVIIARTGRLSNETFYDYRYQPNTGGSVSLWWSEAYEAISNANLVIGQIDNLADSPEKDNILGQALAARAIAHFDLVRAYAKIPTQSADAAQSPGIIYIKVEDGDTDDPLANPTRETVASNYTEILGDLTRASQLIGDDNGEGRLNKNGVFGMLSRVYLYNGQYQDAISAANQVDAPIATKEQLPGVFTDDNNAGVLIEWSVNTSSESTYENVGVLYSQTVSGDLKSEYVIDYAFYTSIDTSDVRRPIMVERVMYSNNDYNAINKFKGEGTQINGLLDIKVLRMAEVFLNKAEAQFELGMETEALATLNVLRAERYNNFVAGTETGSALEEAIQFNRRVELSFEGHRFFDLKRRGKAITRSDFGDFADGGGTPAEIKVLPAGDNKFQLPLPIGETNANSNIEQNPGY